MMQKHSVSVSLVIPAYNEEMQLAACLDAIAQQTVKPLEVLVVDNNSTDATAAVARRYPFVTVLHERRQGPAYARDCGFDAARADVIGRIDADSILAPNWVATVQQTFADGRLEATSGQISYRNVGLSRAIDTFDRYIRSYMSRHMGALGEQFLYGSNMAIRRDAWLRVRSQLCHKSYLHEDIDLAAHLAGPNARVGFSPAMRATVDWRQAAAGPRQFLSHVWSSDRVFTEHQLVSRRYERRVALFVSCMYPIIHLLYRGYNPHKGRFSLCYLITNSLSARQSPVYENL